MSRVTSGSMTWGQLSRLMCECKVPMPQVMVAYNMDRVMTTVLKVVCS